MAKAGTGTQDKSPERKRPNPVTSVSLNDGKDEGVAVKVPITQPDVNK